MQFGLLTVLYRAEDYVQPSGQHKRIWHCRCKCGNECDIRASDLKSGNTKSCGCLQQSSRGKSTFEDLTGKEFGRLTVLFRLPDHITPSGQKQRMWRCKCTCGKECDVYGSQLKNGKKSCGCIVEEEKKRKETAKAIIEKGEYSSSDKQTDTLIKKYLKSAEKATQRKSERRLAEKKERLLKKKIALESSSVAIKNPELLAEWNTTKNGLLTPYDVTPGSGKKVWWKCSLGHEWQATIGSRVNGNGCPYCSNQRVLIGFNDLATTNPELLTTLSLMELHIGKIERVLWKRFLKIYILDLCGNVMMHEKAPSGERDENVFDITQGVSICLLVHDSSKRDINVFHYGPFGKRTTVINPTHIENDRRRRKQCPKYL